MRVLSVVGARPQFVKLAPIAAECARRDVDHRIVHTGQHYDRLLSDVFFADLKIPAPDLHLGVGSGTHGQQTGAMLGRLDEVLTGERPDWVLVYGDTNSTLAATLSAVKLGLPLAHVEAGLRSFNRAMPEEINRVATDHCADLLLAPSQVAMDHLDREGLTERSVLVGDVMVDILMMVRDGRIRTTTSATAAEATTPIFGESKGDYSVATIHRAENTDDPRRLQAIIDSLAAVDHPVLLLAHPRLVERAGQHDIPLRHGAIELRDPLPYPELIAAVAQSRGVITDSGGLQKEAFVLRVPCTTVRTETEWPETTEGGWNVLVEPGPALPAAASRKRPDPLVATPYGSGHAASAMLDALRAGRTRR
ncbi:MAG: UDP-N-acetylglucosamine 2-epimerase (non-hydrolyzing) [Ornithinimicrobium sp.]